MNNKSPQKEAVDRIFNQMIDQKRLSVHKPYMPEEEKDWEYDPMPQGFPGQQWSKKFTKKQKGWIAVCVIAGWVMWILTLLKILL